MSLDQDGILTELARRYDMLGPIEEAYNVNLPAQRQMRIVKIHNSPSAGASTLLTEGLSVLSDQAGDPILQELMFCCYDGSADRASVGLVAAVAKQMVAGRRTLGLGDVLGPAGPVRPGSQLEALLVYAPTYHQEGFGRVQVPGDEEVAIRWLIPLYKSEAEWLKSHRLEEFEKILADRDPDLLDLGREPPLI